MIRTCLIVVVGLFTAAYGYRETARPLYLDLSGAEASRYANGDDCYLEFQVPCPPHLHCGECEHAGPCPTPTGRRQQELSTSSIQDDISGTKKAYVALEEHVWCNEVWECNACFKVAGEWLCSAHYISHQAVERIEFIPDPAAENCDLIAGRAPRVDFPHLIGALQSNGLSADPFHQRIR